MSTEIHLDAFLPEISESIAAGSHDDFDRFDPVLFTTVDRPGVVTIPTPVDPAGDHLEPELARRRADVEEKHRRILTLMDALDYDAIVLTRADSIAWFTSGGNLGRDLGSDHASIALYISKTTRAVLTDNVQSARVFEEELAALGFQLKERPWHADPSKTVAELTHNKKAAADTFELGLPCVLEKLRGLRLPLTTLERFHYRGLGRALTLAVEATCKNIHPGETEAEVAGQLAHRLIREGVVPVDLRIAADDRLARYRQPSFQSSVIRNRATVSVIARRHGLCASVTRVVAFGSIDDHLRADHTLATMVDATCIYFSRPGEPISGVFRRAKRIYEKFHHANEWMLDYQGWMIGYSPRELAMMPDSPTPLVSGSALCWSPTINAARSEDTIVIDDRGFEVITGAQDWPTVEVTVKGFSIHRPGILER